MKREHTPAIHHEFFGRVNCLPSARSKPITKFTTTHAPDNHPPPPQTSTSDETWVNRVDDFQSARIVLVLI